ncbi:hypothetical protein QR680_003312 [Steinernema hermaphroditum]|uniref:Uncharacterized protein n=1 Tax=Steinernema hermaphroditum TaxID=289476 RepID=A0AA39H792_9BILA|nr:hypothetical protein QR680_003312 [Steinernema hermaphroditum]
MTSVYIVDAFTDEKFGGNQAAVCLFNEEKTPEEYQKIASEFNLPVTVFPIPVDVNDFRNAQTFSIRWFTPTNEIALCGHATLAAFHVIFHHERNYHNSLSFHTKSGPATVEKVSDGKYKINFPMYPLKSLKIGNLSNPLAETFDEVRFFQLVQAPDFMYDIVKHMNVESEFQGAVYCPDLRYVVVVLDENLTKNEFVDIDHRSNEMVKFDPKADYLQAIALCLKPKDAQKQDFVDKDGKAYDYATRFFCPWIGINEDRATGSSHCVLGALWREFVAKDELYAYQYYPGRGAQFLIKPSGERVEITGTALTIVVGKANF